MREGGFSQSLNISLHLVVFSRHGLKVKLKTKHSLCFQKRLQIYMSFTLLVIYCTLICNCFTHIFHTNTCTNKADFDRKESRRFYWKFVSITSPGDEPLGNSIVQIPCLFLPYYNIVFISVHFAITTGNRYHGHVG